MNETQVGIGYLQAKLDGPEPPGVLYLTADEEGKKRIGYNIFTPLGRKVELVVRVLED
jgi:hypothetical protein